jgi:hypothetical protein
MVSFAFDDGQYLAVSIETRKERGETYSAVQGFFRQYELIYLFADERDVLGVRTEHRGEDVYLYRTKMPRDIARGTLLDYIRSANALRDEPQFYNALTSNCATNIIPHVRAGRGPNAGARFSWSILLNGYSDHLIYDRASVDTSRPFEELRTMSRINDAAHAAAHDPDFSKKIRVGLPMPPR